MVVMGKNTLREKIVIRALAPLKESVLNTCGCQDGAEMELRARAVGEQNVGAVLRVAMADSAFRPASDAPGDVDDYDTEPAVSTAHDIPGHRAMI